MRRHLKSLYQLITIPDFYDNYYHLFHEKLYKLLNALFKPY